MKTHLLYAGVDKVRRDPNPVCSLKSVTSDEPENGLGDGDTAPDIQITGPFAVDLRAERAGGGDGRTYTITVECTDVSGNISTGITTVEVPPGDEEEGDEIEIEDED